MKRLFRNRRRRRRNNQKDQLQLDVKLSISTRNPQQPLDHSIAHIHTMRTTLFDEPTLTSSPISPAEVPSPQPPSSSSSSSSSSSFLVPNRERARCWSGRDDGDLETNQALMFWHDDDDDDDAFAPPTTLLHEMEGFATPCTPSGFPMAILLHNGMERPRSVWELWILHCVAVIRDTPRWYEKILKDHNRKNSVQELWKTKAKETIQGYELMGLCHYRVDVGRTKWEEIWLWAWQESCYMATLPHQRFLSAVDHVYCNDWNCLVVVASRKDSKDVPDDNLLGDRIRRHVDQLRRCLANNGVDRETSYPGLVNLLDPSMYAFQEHRGHVQPSETHGDDNSRINCMQASKMVAPPFLEMLGKHPPQLIHEEDSVMVEDTICRSQFISKNGYQWLPSEFYVYENKKDGSLDCRINSYINSLHPGLFADFYRDLEELFCLAVPLLEQTLTEVSCVPTSDQRVCLIRERELRVPVPAYSEYQRQQQDRKRNSTRPPSVLPIPKFEKPHKEDDLYTCPRIPLVSLRERPLQVVVKITSIELNPGQGDHEEYPGSSFQVEGLLNDRIVATACCYLNNDNLNGGDVEFRTSIWEPNCDDERYNITWSSITHEVEEWRSTIFGLNTEDRLFQSRGKCSTPAGRILAWPNTLQSRVTPALLRDPTRPGSRTAIHFYLVDPTLRIPSTATFPPQQLSWVKQELDWILSKCGLDEEANRDQVLDYLFSFPDSPFLSHEKAREQRQVLNEERTVTMAAEDVIVDNPMVIPEDLHHNGVNNDDNNQLDLLGAADAQEEEINDDFFSPVIQQPSFVLGSNEGFLMD